MIKVITRKEYNSLPEDKRMREEGRNFLITDNGLVLVLFKEEV